MHVGACVSSAWFIFNLNTEFSRYLQIIYYSIYTLGSEPLNPPFSSLLIPPLSSLFIPLLFSLLIPCYLLEELASFARGASAHPLLSLVC
jgi:hypothetical protein